VAAVNPALLVGLGGVAGAVARHLFGERIEDRRVDTLAVNVVGSFLLGAVVAAPRGLVSPSVELALGAGFCGAFTTFSTFAFETVRLAETGDPRGAAVNATVNLIGALAAVLLGGMGASALL
jgi:CrcB protein